jgi:hypothetical protein
LPTDAMPSEAYAVSSDTFQPSRPPSPKSTHFSACPCPTSLMQNATGAHHGQRNAKTKDQARVPLFNPAVCPDQGSPHIITLNYEQHLLYKLYTLSRDTLYKQRIETLLQFKLPDDLLYSLHYTYLDSIDSPQDGTGAGFLSQPKFAA